MQNSLTAHFFGSMCFRPLLSFFTKSDSIALKEGSSVRFVKFALEVDNCVIFFSDQAEWDAT
jgi:hypothetical protein